jgi:hypothetical protein
MFAILTDIAPSFATVAKLVLIYDLAEAVAEMGDADEVMALPVCLQGIEVGDRFLVDHRDFIADPLAACA